MSNKKHSAYALRSKLRDLSACAILLRSPAKAWRFFRNSSAFLETSFKKHSICFAARKKDWGAIREVLVEDEYRSVVNCITKNSGARVLDLGANIGCFAIRVFGRCPRASVVSVELAPDNFTVLRHNQQMNAARDWTVVNMAVWSENSTVALRRSQSPLSHSAVRGGSDVRAITIESLVTDIGWNSVDLIKMDIEGAEAEAIPTGLGVLRKTRYFALEVHADQVDEANILKPLKNIYRNIYLVEGRLSRKPLYLFTNETLAHPLKLHLAKVSPELFQSSSDARVTESRAPFNRKNLTRSNAQNC